VDTFIRSLRDKAKVEEHPELLDQLKIDPPDAGVGGTIAPRSAGGLR
jgi:hypothetical protein